jgi:antibiotic biosynthesis monooxygenase (ABM) superfamily enzyme
VTRQNVDDARKTYDALVAKKQALFAKYPGLQTSELGIDPLGPSAEGLMQAQVPDVARQALDVLNAGIDAARRTHGNIKSQFDVIEQARRKGEQKQAVADLLKGL